MKRDWFSRRWVVQEIALAKRAWLLAGQYQVKWIDFADTVSFFNEVETGTRSLSQVTKSKEEYGHIPDFFGHVPALSATRLVEATNELFRRSQNNDKEPLLSLEYLVSTFSVFEATEPRNTIYALLAIARDTSPKTATSVEDSLAAADSVEDSLAAAIPPSVRALFRNWERKMITSQPYHVDYAQSVFDVFKEFVIFSIAKSGQTRALDIICRPWAPEIKPVRTSTQNADGKASSVEDLEQDSSSEEETETIHNDGEKVREEDRVGELPSWMPRVSGAAFAMDGAEQKMGRKNADPLVGVPPQRNYRAAGSRTVTKELRFEDGITQYSRDPSLNGAVYHSMFVEGFVLDTVGKVAFPSQHDNIPDQWRDMGGWRKDTKKRPEDFWRTLVVDRRPYGLNPPGYYPRLLDHAISQGIDDDTVNTTDIINYGNCSVVRELLRRIQSVIWNRRLMRTGRGVLGLAPQRAETNDVVCILYGCSVPVILRRFEKTQQEVEDEILRREESAVTAATTAVFKSWRYKQTKKGLEEMVEKKRRRDEDDLERRSNQGPPRKRHRKDDGLEGGSNAATAPVRQRGGRNDTEDGLNSTDRRSSTRGRRGKAKAAEEATSNQAARQGITGQAGSKVEKRQTLCPSGYRATLSGLGTTSGESDKAKSILNPSVYYTLIGECYVHGMMDDEAIDYFSKHGLKREVFEIR